jgi:FkbM family methyltransferase
MTKSYSQIGQDLEVLKRYNNKRNGYFVDIGASDGITYSNTYILEKEYGWKGICAEPLPSKWNQLINNRPLSACCPYAIFNKSNTFVKFIIANCCDLFSGIDETLTCEKYRKWINDNKEIIDIQTISLNDLLIQFEAPNFIEYLSLDTEGSEYEILKNFDFSKYTFGLIDVEHNFQEPNRTNIRELLLANGYIYLNENKWDDCYVSQT